MKKDLTGYPHIDKPWMKYYKKDLVETDDPKVNLTEYLKDKTKKNDSDTANTYYGKKTSYQEFWNNVDNASKVLTDFDIKCQDKIMY